MKAEYKSWQGGGCAVPPVTTLEGTLWWFEGLLSSFPRAVRRWSRLNIYLQCLSRLFVVPNSPVSIEANLYAVSFLYMNSVPVTEMRALGLKTLDAKPERDCGLDTVVQPPVFGPRYRDTIRVFSCVTFIIAMNLMSCNI